MSPPPEASVALWARLYRLLADRPEFMHEDLGERIDRTAPDVATCVSEVDAELVAHASELDRLCGYAVRLLRRGGAGSSALLDLLGVLRPERVAAIAYALPEERRRALAGRDPNWARAVASVDEDVMKEVNAIADDIDALGRKMDDGFRRLLGPEVAHDIERVFQEQRKLVAGLPHDLSPEEVVALDQSREEAAAERGRRTPVE